MVENMEWYRVFYYTAKTGSLSKAAAELFITQPAVTHTIKQLEAKLGGQLFFRTSKGVKLTSEGETLYQYIEQAYHFIENGERRIAEMHQLNDGEIKIGAGDTLCKHFLLPILTTFHETYPAVKIQVTNRTTPETVELLKQGRIDLGIVNLPLADRALEIRETMRIHDCLIAGEAFKQLAQRQRSWEDLLKYPVMLLEKGSVTRAFFDRYAEEQGVMIKPEIELGSVDLLVEFARTGLGIACVVRDFIADELKAGEIYEIQLKKPIPARGIGIVTLKDVPLSAAADRFIQDVRSAHTSSAQ